jgi:hypothetical protein
MKSRAISFGGHARRGIQTKGELMRIILVGVEHRIQWIPQNSGLEWQQDLNQFAQHLRDIVLEEKADLMAEEFSEESIQTNNALDSVARNVASSLSITHLFCDPNKTERRQLEIVTGGQRESLWLARLAESNASTAVFVCGDNHIDSFREKATAAGHKVQIKSRNSWGYEWPLK